MRKMTETPVVFGENAMVALDSHARRTAAKKVAASDPRIPECYAPVHLRTVTPWDLGQVGVGLETEEGTPIRIRLTLADAAALVRLLRSR